MEIIASDLKDALSRLAGVLTNKGLVEGSESFIFNENTIHVFDGETFIEVTFETGVKGAVEGQSFLKYIEKMGTAKIEISQNDKCVNIKKGKAVASFLVQDEDSAPPVQDTDTWMKAPDNFLAALNACSFTVGKDYTDMRTVVIHMKDSYAESTDEERITRFKLGKKIKCELFIPVDLVPALSRAKITHYSQSEDWMSFKNQEGDRICHRNIALGDSYQDLASVVNECNEGEKIEFPDKMYDAIEKAAIFQANLKIESDRKITVRSRAGKIRIESHGTHGNFSETLTSGLEQNFAFIINPAFMLQIMEKSNTVYFHADYIRIETEDYVFLTSLNSEE